MRATISEAQATAPATPQQPTATVSVPIARPGYLSPKAAAEFTGISVPELERLRRVGGGPRFCAPSPRLIRYKVEDLCDWLDSFGVYNTSQAIELAAKKGVAHA